FEFWNGGVIVAMAPDVLFLKDTDGDDRADVRVRILDGIDSADTHHTANSFVFEPGGAVYFQEGVFHRTQIETPYGPVRNTDACVWRFDPRTYKLDRYIPYGFANPHGHVFDRWGQDIVHDGTGAQPYHGAIFSGHLEFPQKHPHAPQVYQQRTRPCPATEILSSRHFPTDMQGNLLVGNVIGFQGILRYRLDDKGSSIAGTELEPLVSSNDPNFRPADLEIGADGALYFTDWHNPIIGHMQHNLRDPSRDRTHGRVYRLTAIGRPLSQSPPIAGQPIEKLLDLLKHPEDRVRYRTRTELSGRDTKELIAALGPWCDKLSKGDPDYDHHLLEGLWLYQQHNVVSLDLLERVLAARDGRARAAATRVLCYWRDRVSDSLDRLKKLAGDDDPRVRLQAMRAASFYTAPEAVEVVLVAQQRPDDEYLKYTRGETLKALEPYWQKALAAGQDIPVTTDAGARFFLRQINLDQLFKKDRSRAVYLELLFRPGVRDEYRREALVGLAKLGGIGRPQGPGLPAAQTPEGRPQTAGEPVSDLRVLLDAVHAIDQKKDDYEQSVVFDLVRLLTERKPAELTKLRGELEKLATAARQPVIRQVAFSALIAIDRSVDRAWQLGMQSAAALYDLVSAVPLVSDPALRAELYSKIEPLVRELPAPLAGEKSKGTQGRYVRIELPRKGTLTLAEVEVYSGGQNVARGGRASQKNTVHGGDAKRAIDGKTNGDYNSGTQTHTQENGPEPWWQVDLGDSYEIEKIVVYNRRDGGLGKRLEGFTLAVLDEQQREVYRRDGNPAPETKAEFDVEVNAGNLVRRAAMNALTYVRGQETKTFQTLAGLASDNVDRLAAVRAMQRIGRQYWPKEQARPLLDVLLAQIRGLPVEDRAAQSALDMLEFSDALASLLPVDEARRLRGELRELGVRVIRVGTLPERMSYDQDTLALAAGKPVQFVLENADLMPHNFVIVRPGALEEVGLLGESTAQQPGAVERQYVPPSDKILLASQLVPPRGAQRLTFTAPKEPGVYPYVCTYPGHWRRMYGAMYVVEDLDQYLANPESYLAAHPLSVKDDLLKDRRPRTEWKLADLAQPVQELSQGRSLAAAKQMFQVASCSACHKLGGVGNQIGPDLSKLEAKYRPLDILKEILDPSAQINEKFQTYTFVTDSGQTITGLILEETADTVKVIENPLAKAEPVVLKKSEIDEREKAKTSIMPKGLLDKLSRDEILDLIAYIAARGDEHSSLFEGGEGHHHH
ncbi:MAG TPA: HEAT repeat domain-containing protein, partial [Pirellulales bacterium]|nr:HEAT repeat domain-containing protein [Pirellulales bacterium]